MFRETDVTVVMGQRGCGKSTLSRKIAGIYPRLVVIDRLKEWNRERVDWRGDNFNDFARFLTTCISTARHSFKAVFQFDVEAEDKEAVFTEVVRLCYLFGQSGRGIALLVEEVHHFAAPLSIDPWLFESIMTGRHARMAIIANSQRPASVSKALISQASHVFVGRLFEQRDVKYLREFIGEDADKAAMLAMPPRPAFIHYQPGIGSQIVRP